MSGKQTRLAEVETVVLTDALGTTAKIRMGPYASGGIIIGAVHTSVTTLTFYGATTRDGEYALVKTVANASTVITVADVAAYPFPDAAFAFPFLKIVVNADSGASFEICMKS